MPLHKNDLREIGSVEIGIEQEVDGREMMVSRFRKEPRVHQAEMLW
jgi:hypothetical protein